MGHVRADEAVKQPLSNAPTSHLADPATFLAALRRPPSERIVFRGLSRPGMPKQRPPTPQALAPVSMARGMSAGLGQ